MVVCDRNYITLKGNKQKKNLYNLRCDLVENSECALVRVSENLDENDRDEIYGWI